MCTHTYIHTYTHTANADQDNEKAEEEHVVHVSRKPPVAEKTMMQFLKDKNLNLHDRNLVQRLSKVCMYVCMCVCMYVVEMLLVKY